MSEDAKVLIEFIKQEWEQERQIENLRATITNWVVVLTVAIVGLIVDRGLSRMTLPLAVLLMVIGIYGMLASMKLYERFLFHRARVREWRKRVDQLHPDAQLLKLRQAAHEKHTIKHPRLARLRLHTIWNWLHFLVFLAGVGLTIAVVLQ